MNKMSISGSGFLFLTLAALALLPAFSVAQAPAPTPASLDFGALEETIKAEMAASKVPGAECVVLVGGRVAYRAAFGVRSVETGSPVAPEDLFRLGSTTKMIVAAACLEAEARGLVRLDAPIGEKAPELHPALARLTLNQLLSHTAGLAEDAPMAGPLDETALAARVRAWDEKAFFAEPGRIMSYANPGYVLAGYVLERATGKPFADAVSTLVLAPLGMAKSTFRPLQALTYPVALGHQPGPNGPAVVRPFAENAANWAPGSLFTNIDEFARFLAALLDDGRLEGAPVLRSGLTALMTTPRAEIRPLGRSYGYGLVMLRERGLDVAMHSGARTGYGSVVYAIPDKKFAVAILTNSSGAILFRSARKAAEIACPGGAEEPAKPEPARPSSAAEVAAWAGTYVNGSLKVELAASGDRLSVKAAGKTFPAERIGERTFRAPGAGQLSRFVLVPGPDGAVAFLTAEYWALARVRSSS